MRRSLIGLVPHVILCRKTKQFGARTPVIALEKNLDQLQLVFSSSLASDLGYVSQAPLLETLNAARNGETVHITSLLKTIALEFWLRDLVSRRVIDSAFPPQQSPHGGVDTTKRMARTVDFYHSG